MTFDLESTIRTHILDMPAYQPIYPFDVVSQELGIPQEDIIKLDANENPYGPLPEVLEGLSRLSCAHIYPDPESRRIRALLSQYQQINEESIIISAGADELIDIIMRLVIDPGDALINCPPTFGMYAFDGDLNQARVIDVPRREDFTLDLAAIQEAIREYEPKLLFLANPNNPDGQLVPSDSIQALLELPILLVLDEAYINFSGKGSSWISKVCEYSNLIVLRTFSKWAGLAGLRIGYGVFPEILAPIIMKTKQPYNVSVAAEEAACSSMLNIHKLERITLQIVRERERLFNKLCDVPWLIPYPSCANFILCKVREKNASDVKRYLREKGIMVRHFDKPGLSDHIRISVGKPEHTDILSETLRNME